MRLFVLCELLLFYQVTMQKIIFFLLLLGTSITLGGDTYEPFDRGLKDKEDRIERLEDKLKLLTKSEPNKTKKSIKEEVLYSTQNLLNRIYEEDQIIRDLPLRKYFEGIFEKIRTGNPELRITKPRYIHVIDNPSVNAFTVLDDRIYINLGLIDEVDSEGELVFVFCHELAHYYLKHSLKHLDGYAEKWTSKEMKQKIAKAKSSGSVAETIKLIEEFSFDGSTHSRYKEFEADSLGMVFYTNAGYFPENAYSLMDVLDNCDQVPDVTDLFTSLINFEEYPFQEKLQKSESGLGGFFTATEEETEKKEKLRSHPDCQKRKAKLKTFGFSNVLKKQKENSAFFDQLKVRAKYERVLSYYNYASSDLAVIKILDLMKETPNDPYLVMALGKIFNSMRYGLENYEASQFLMVRSNFLGDSHKKVYEIMQNANSNDYKHWAYYFLKSKYDLLYQHEDLLEEWKNACEVMEDEDELLKISKFLKNN